MTVGVPLMLPVVELRVRPVGSAGEMANVAMAPPVLVSVTGGIESPRVRVELVVEMERTATGSLMVMVKVRDADPPELLAQNV